IEWEYPPAWRDKLISIFERFSSRGPKAFLDIFEDLQRRGLFERHGFQRTSTIPFEQSIEDFIRALQSTSSLSRVTLGERTAAFAAEVRALFASLGVDRVAFPVAGSVVWGRPLRPRAKRRSAPACWGFGRWAPRSRAAAPAGGGAAPWRGAGR